MKIETNLLKEYVNFVDNTKKRNEYFKVFITLFVVILRSNSFFVLFHYISK